MLPALGAWRLNRWTTREVLKVLLHKPYASGPQKGSQRHSCPDFPKGSGSEVGRWDSSSVANLAQGVLEDFVQESMGLVKKNGTLEMESLRVSS